MLDLLRGCASSQHDGRCGNRREYRFAWIAHDAFPPVGLIFPNQTIRVNGIVNKASEISRQYEATVSALRLAIIVDNLRPVAVR